MSALQLKKLSLTLLCALFLAFSLPVQAQTGIPQTDTVTDTPSPSAAVMSDEETPEISSTPSVFTQTASPAIEFPLITDTPLETPTPEPTFAPSVTGSPTVLQPTVNQTACQTENVYQWQITVSYYGTSVPEPSASFTVVENFTAGDSTQASVLQVNEADFCRVLEELRNNTRVITAEPNFTVSMLDTIPNDPNFSLQYYLGNIRAPRGWDFTVGSTAVTIAVIDSGIDLTHPDLAVKIVPGFDFVSNDETPQDENGHGTLAAGISAAASNNGIGIAGVSWKARIMPLRVLDASGNGSYNSLSEAIIWAADHGARVINMSLGGPNYSEVLANAVEYAISKGSILVAAAGNSGASSLLYPAALPGVIGVGATDSSNQLAWFSNTGPGIDVVAPGVSILSTSPGNGYQYSSGTSMSAPQVSGFAALLASLPELPYSSQIVDLIHSSALDLGGKGYDLQYGYGLIQIGPAIRSVLEDKYTPTDSPKGHEPQHTPTLSPPIFYIPSEIPVLPFSAVDTGSGSVTVTPGEVYMQQVAATKFTPALTESLAAPTPASEQTLPSQAIRGSESILLFFMGIIYIVLGLLLFFYVRKYLGK